ncbi:MAG: TRAM domain-containing protein [Microthrixaceae bacterium]
MIVELETTGMANGGEAVARDGSGRVVFVEGALDGERVAVEVIGEKRRFARARLVEVLEPSAERVRPACPEVDRGCGGCDLSHASHVHQLLVKAQVVEDALERIGRLEAIPPIAHGPALRTSRFRSTVRAGVVEGLPGSGADEATN